MSERLKTFVHVQLEDEAATVDILRSGLVRLSVNNDPASAVEAETLEDVMLLAAAHPDLSQSVYDALMWELDLLGLRGQ